MGPMKIKTIISVIIIFSVLFFSCTPVKYNCGTQGQHKTRIKNSKKMAPSMMNKYD